MGGIVISIYFNRFILKRSSLKLIERHLNKLSSRIDDIYQMKMHEFWIETRLILFEIHNSEFSLNNSFVENIWIPKILSGENAKKK